MCLFSMGKVVDLHHKFVYTKRMRNKCLRTELFGMPRKFLNHFYSSDRINNALYFWTLKIERILVKLSSLKTSMLFWWCWNNHVFFSNYLWWSISQQPCWSKIQHLSDLLKKWRWASLFMIFMVKKSRNQK